MKSKIIMSDKEFFIKMDMLTSMNTAEHYIEEKNVGMVWEILGEYRSFKGMFEKDDFRRDALDCRISQLKRALRRLNLRTEEEIEKDFMEQELLQIAMYG